MVDGQLLGFSTRLADFAALTEEGLPFLDPLRILELFLVVRRAVYELGPRDSCDEIYALPSYAGMLCAAYVDGLNLSRATAAVIDLAKKDPTISNAELEAFLKAAPQFEALIMEDFFEDLTVCDGEIRKVS